MMSCSGNRTEFNVFIAIPGDRRELFRSETVRETTGESISRRYIVYAALYTLYILFLLPRLESSLSHSVVLDYIMYIVQSDSQNARLRP